MIIAVFAWQGHVAYPHLADNPIHRAFIALHALVNENWDEGNEDFPKTTLQISNIHSGTGATNVIPESLEVKFNLRFSTAITPDQIQSRVTGILEQHALSYDIKWHLSGKPFLTKTGKLLSSCQNAISKITSLQTTLSTAGGTSDGRFIAPTGAEVIELGPVNATIHQVDEHVDVEDLNVLTNIYTECLCQLLT